MNVFYFFPENIYIYIYEDIIFNYQSNFIGHSFLNLRWLVYSEVKFSIKYPCYTMIRFAQGKLVGASMSGELLNRFWLLRGCAEKLSLSPTPFRVSEIISFVPLRSARSFLTSIFMYLKNTLKQFLKSG